MNLSIHRVTSITMDEPEALKTGTYVRHITIKSTHICDGEIEDVICLFSDTEEPLFLGEMK